MPKTDDKIEPVALELPRKISPVIAHEQHYAVITLAGGFCHLFEAGTMKTKICLFDLDKALGPAKRICTLTIDGWYLTNTMHDNLPLLRITQS